MTHQKEIADERERVMDVSETVILHALSRQNGTKNLIDRGDSAVQQFYCGAAVFVTGGSGFLGKQLIEKLLRTCRIRKVYMLMRSKKGKSVEERLDRIFEDALYDTLREEQPNFIERIVPIIGDVAEMDLGISDKDRESIIKEVNVIFHVAATISFQEPLRSATLTNVRGTRELMKLAKQCTKLRSFIYMSTAYSHATFSRRNSEVFEQFYPTPLSPHLMIQLAETLDEQRLNKITDGLIMDWPNTYAFTKALAEELLASSADDLPICVIRPSIVICARREPYTGWIDKGSVLGPNGITLGSLMGVIHVLQSDQNIRIDFIPVDYVTNAAIVAAVIATKDVKIYTVGSSCRNHITWGGLSHILNNVVKRTLVSPETIWYCFVVQSANKWVFKILSFLLHNVPANIVDGLCLMMNKPTRLKKIYATINKMAAIVSFYTNNSWTFNDNNTFKLFNNLSESDKAIYYCDITDVEWTEQIVLWCVGLRKFIIKDGLKGTNWAMKKQFYYKIATYVTSALFICVIWLFLRYVFIFVKYIFNF